MSTVKDRTYNEKLKTVIKNKNNVLGFLGGGGQQVKSTPRLHE